MTKVIGKIEVLIGEVKILGTDGTLRDATVGGSIYAGEQIVSTDPGALFEIKYLAFEETSTYEGIFRVLTDGSVISDVDAIDSIINDKVLSDLLETAAGQDEETGNSRYIPGDIVAASSVQDFGKGANHNNPSINDNSKNNNEDNEDNEENNENDGDMNNFAPTAEDASNVATEDDNTSVVSGQLLGVDLDGNLFDFVLVDDLGEGEGVVTLNSNGSYVYNINGDFQELGVGETREVTFTYKTVETNTLEAYESEIATVTIIITGTNDAPILSNTVIIGSVSEEVQGGFELATLIDSGTMVFTDVDLSDTHAVEIFETSTEKVENLGILTASISEDNDGDGIGEVTWNYSVDNADVQYLGEGETKTDTFRVILKDTDAFDNLTGTVSSQVVTVTITGTNDAPTVTSEVVSGEVTEDKIVQESDTLVTTGDIVLNDVDLLDVYDVTVDTDTNLGTLSATVVTVGEVRTLTWDYEINNADVDYLAADEIKEEAFTLTITSDKGDIVTKEVTITITGTNDQPEVAAVDIIATETDGLEIIASGTLTETDLDTTDTHTFAIAGVASVDNTDVVGLNVVVNTDGTYSVEGNFDALNVDEIATVTFNYVATDNSGLLNAQSTSATVTLTITGTNDAPVINVVAAVDVDEDSELIEGTVTSSDLDQNSTAIYSAPETAGFIINSGTGVYSFDPSNTAYQYLNAGEPLTVTIPITVTDDNDATDTTNIVINMIGTNDAPIANTDIDTTQENTTIIVDVLSNDTDVDTTHSFTLNSVAIVDANDSGDTIAPIGTLGSVSIVNNQLVFNPGTDFDYLADTQNTTVTINYTMSDEHDAESSSSLTLTITGTDDQPTVTASTFFAQVTYTDVAVAHGEIVAQGDGTSVDQWSFTHHGGALTIDMLSEGAYSYGGLDTMIRIFNSSGVEIGQNDDSSAGTSDGSFVTQDSYLNFSSLPTGTYTLSVGAYELTNSEALDDYNNHNTEGYISTGTYQITFTGDVTNIEQTDSDKEILHVFDIDGGSVNLGDLTTLTTIDKVELSGKTEINISVDDVIKITDDDNELIITSTDDLDDTFSLEGFGPGIDNGTTTTYKGSDENGNIATITIENTIIEEV